MELNAEVGMGRFQVGLMKIAANSEDGITISQHLGWAPLYVVVTIEGGKIMGKEMREKAIYQPPDLGLGQTCGYDGCPHPGHESLASIISDCQVLFTGGIGWGALQAMKEYHIETLVTDVGSIDEAVKLYLEGKLTNIMEE